MRLSSTPAYLSGATDISRRGDRCARSLPPALLAAIAAAMLATGPLAAADIQARFLYSDDTLLSYGPYTFEGGKTLNLTVGIGSAAFRHPNDPPNVIWTLGDRGANIACSEMKSIAGVDFAPCKDVQNGRVYPTPSYSPSIYRVMLIRRRDVPRHRRHHAQGPRRPADERPAQSAEDRRHRERHGRPRQAAAAGPQRHRRRGDRAAVPTARSGSATRTVPRSPISRPTAA